MKTEQTAKPTPETDTLFLILAYLFLLSLSSFFFPPFIFIRWPKKQQEKRKDSIGTAGLKYGEEKEEEEGDEKCMAMSPIQSQAV